MKIFSGVLLLCCESEIRLKSCISVSPPLHIPHLPPDAGSLVWRGFRCKGKGNGVCDIEDFICVLGVYVRILQKKVGSGAKSGHPFHVSSWRQSFE